MLARVVSILRRILHGLLASDSPDQLAAGFTLGMIIGLVPKGNLVALSLCVLLFSVRVNKGLALIAAIVFSVFGPWADPFAHKLGLVVLNLDALQAVYAAIFYLPLGPWIGFHNSAVTGSLLLGIYFAYPVYWMVRTLCIVLGPAASNWKSRYGVTQTLTRTANDSLSRATT
jgi:uncharacterized protein (TIGR03546 family)